MFILVNVFRKDMPRLWHRTKNVSRKKNAISYGSNVLMLQDKSVVMDTAEEGRPVLDITLEAGMPSVRTLPADRDKEVIDEL